VVEAFLTHLAVDSNVAAATQNEAKSALLFLYREVLAIELRWLDKVARAKHRNRLRVGAESAPAPRIHDNTAISPKLKLHFTVTQ